MTIAEWVSHLVDDSIKAGIYDLDGQGYVFHGTAGEAALSEYGDCELSGVDIDAKGDPAVPVLAFNVSLFDNGWEGVEQG